MWAKRDAGAWSIPKGEYDPTEDALAAAKREFEEELGTPAPDGPVEDLGEVKQKSGKIVSAWAVAGDLDVTEITSNTVEVQWPPRSGKMLEIPEVDRADWFGIQQARDKINAAQAELLDRLAEILGPTE
jgi:predicted NUDIX family NTP pyrophosphohydrolase